MSDVINIQVKASSCQKECQCPVSKTAVALGGQREIQLGFLIRYVYCDPAKAICKLPAGQKTNSHNSSSFVSLFQDKLKRRQMKKLDLQLQVMGVE